MIDYLSLRPVIIDTPEATYRGYRFLLVDTTAQIRGSGDEVIMTATGVVEKIADQEWRFASDDDDDVWLITRGEGCCGGGGIVPKTALEA